MYLAINYSPPAAVLVQSEKIEVDYFKTPDWEWMVSEAKLIKPVAVHFDLEAGNGHLHKVDWDRVELLAKATNTPFINIHIDPKQKHHPGLLVDTDKNSDLLQIYKIIISDVMLLVDKFGPERVIVENSPYRGVPGKTLRLGVAPDLINRVVEETGCGFLFDISHAIISAHYIGMNPYEYFSKLPVHKVKELHFAGFHKIKGIWVDHLSILKKNWGWLDWSLDQIQTGKWSKPWLLAFEYGGVGSEFEWRSDPKVIATQVPMIYERVNNMNLRIRDLTGK